jgi:hypothetical protein
MNEEYILLEELDLSNEILKFIDKVYEEKVGEEDGNIETNNK